MEICSAQAIPTDGAADVSENAYDTGLTTPTYGVGARIHVKVVVTTAFAHSAGDPTLQIDLVTDDAAALSSNKNLCGLFTIPSGISAGQTYQLSIPAAAYAAQQRYLGLDITPSSTQFTAGAIDAFICID